MKEDGSPTLRQHGNGPKSVARHQDELLSTKRLIDKSEAVNRVRKRTVESGANKKGSKSKFHDPCCRCPIQITEQLAFEFYEPTCGNSKQPSPSGTSSEVKP